MEVVVVRIFEEIMVEGVMVVAIVIMETTIYLIKDNNNNIQEDVYGLMVGFKYNAPIMGRNRLDFFQD